MTTGRSDGEAKAAAGPDVSKRSEFGRNHVVYFWPRLIVATYGGALVVKHLASFHARTPLIVGTLAFGALWPFLCLQLRRVWPSNRAANLLVIVDSAWIGLAVAADRTETFALLGVCVWLNTCVVGGFPFAIAGATLGAAAYLAVIGAGLSSTEWVEVSRTEVLASGGFVLGYATLLANLTFRSHRNLTRIRRELRENKSELEARVAERTAALASTNAAISRFVPREFLHALGHDDVRTAKLGDVSSREVTVLFADIRNFTSMSERMSPEQTFAFLNGCLSKIGPHIRAHSGFVDKYIGDAIMALFPGSPADAFRAGLAMQREVASFNAHGPGGAPLAIGVGIHVGAVMMGTIGEAERFEATVISDAVNFAARLESLTKQLGCSMLVSVDVAKHLSPEEREFTRALGTFAVKGKAHAVELVEAFASDDEALRASKCAAREPFAQALAYYTHGEVVEALAIVGELVERTPADAPMAWWLAHMQHELAFEGPASGRHVVRLDEK